MKQQTTLSDPSLMLILDDAQDLIFYGCSQEWFGDPWQRMAGCGPAVAANILLYQDCLARRSKAPCPKSEMLKKMEAAWSYITPGKEGIPSTKSFLDKIRTYALAQGKKLHSQALDIPEDEGQRPALEQVTAFIASSLRAERPVAFLNLDNGRVANLDRWHWVTICALEYDGEAGSAWVTTYDEGALKNIDLKLWLESTTLGGGFASFWADFENR